MRTVPRLLGVALLASGCAFQGIDLVRDSRIAITAPDNGETVSLPLTVRWNPHGFGESDRAVQYAVFVDRTAIKAGQTLRAIVAGTDTSCRRDPHCPDAAYLARHDVYLTSEPQVVISRVGASHERRPAHRITIVILRDGRRDGEGAFSRTVYVRGERR